jgi:hypothetical protein
MLNIYKCKECKRETILLTEEVEVNKRLCLVC